MATVHSKGHSAPSSTDLISTGEVVRLLGIHPNTVRLWCETGQLTAYRLGSGHRRFSRAEVRALAYGEESEVEKKDVVILYGRCSTAKQRADLERQMCRLRTYASENYQGHEVIEFQDLGSGMNLARKNLVLLLSRILRGDYDGATLIVEHKDRLARWAADLIELICKHHSLEVVYVEQQECSDEEMLANDLLSIIHIFSCRSYSRRSSASQAANLPADIIFRAKELLDAGMSVKNAVARLNKEGFRNDGKPLTYGLIYKYVYLAQGKLEKVLPKRANSAEEYFSSFVTAGPAHLRVPQKAIYIHYAKWCRANNKLVVSKRRFFAPFRKSFELRQEFEQFCFCGLKVKGLEAVAYVRSNNRSLK
jgi:putative resolvase